jgi:hypothetical protein
MPYREFQSKTLAPGWLQDTNGKAWQEALGAEKDLQLDINRQSVLADLPRPAAVQVALDDAGIPDTVYTESLDLIGADRMLPRATGETDLVYAERLRTAWDGADGWRFAGSYGSVLRALARAGFPATGLASGAVLFQRTKRYAYLNAGVVTFGTHSGWTFGAGGPETWNQFGLLFGADYAPLTVGSQAALQLDAIIRAWKPAKARYMGCWVVLSGSIWGWPFGVTWGAGGRTWGGSSRFIAPL